MKEIHVGSCAVSGHQGCEADLPSLFPKAKVYKKVAHSKKILFTNPRSETNPVSPLWSPGGVLL